MVNSGDLPKPSESAIRTPKKPVIKTQEDRDFDKNLVNVQKIAAAKAKSEARDKVELERWPLRNLSSDEVYDVAHLENTLAENSRDDGKSNEKINPTTEKVLRKSIETFWDNAKMQLDQNKISTTKDSEKTDPSREVAFSEAKKRLDKRLAEKLIGISEGEKVESQDINVVDLIEESPILEDDDFKGKVVVITGVAGGIGSVLAEEYCKMGSIVYAIDNRADELTGVVDGIRAKNPSFQIHKVIADVSRPDQWVRQLDEAPRIDILLNNAAITDPKLRPEDPNSVPPTVAESAALTREIGGWEKIKSDFINTMMADLVGPYLLMLYATERGLKDGNQVLCVNTASTNLDTLKPNRAAYISAKSGLITLTELFAQEFSWDRFRYNVVSPGATNTPLLENPAEAIKSLPLGLSEPIDIFWTTKYLTSRMSRRTTGANIRVDGAKVAAQRKKNPQSK